MTQEKEKDKDKDADKGNGRPPIPILVNEQEVKMDDATATGDEIKSAAIAQNVHIQQNFMLIEELPNGTSRKIANNEQVKLRPHMRFTAIAPDDNS